MQRDGRPRIKLPDGVPTKDSATESNFEYDVNYKKRQQLITFGHNQWGFKNWNWSVTKQELDFVDYVNGKYTAGVVAFVSVTVTSLGLHREDIGYATTVSTQKGSAVYNARKVSVTNALRETLLGFGGDLAVQLMEQLEMLKADNQTEKKSNDANNDVIDCNPDSLISNGPPKIGQSPRKDSIDSTVSTDNVAKGIRIPQRYNNHQKNMEKPSNSSHIVPQPISVIQQTDTPNISANQTIITKPVGFVANPNTKVVHSVSLQVPPPPAIAAGNVRPNPAPVTAPNHPSNVSYLVQHVMPPLYSVQCAAPHTPPPPLYHNTYFTEYPPWPIYDNFNKHNNANLNMPPKNFVMNGRNGMEQTCGSRLTSVHAADDASVTPNTYVHHPFNMNGSWIKPTIFYDGFWTEQKVKKWVAEQMEKPHVEETKITHLSDVQKHMCHSKVLQPDPNMTAADKNDEELRAERIRRQRQKMEEFKSKQMQRYGNAPLENKLTEGKRRDSIVVFSSQDSNIDENKSRDPNLKTSELKRANSDEMCDAKRKCL